MRKNAIEEEKILKQIDKTYILCIDPETRLPFMINMGMKLAEMCDLDNRPYHIKQAEASRLNKSIDQNDQDQSFDSESEQSFNITKN